MDPMHLDNNVDDLMEEYSEHSLSSSDSNGISGEPQMVPRVGDQYQAEIPEIVPERDRLELIKRATDTEATVDQQNLLLFGLPIPVMWAKSENINKILEAESAEESQDVLGNKCFERPKNGCANAESKAELAPKSGTIEIVLALPRQSTFIKMNRPRLETRPRPFPGALGETWKDVERDSFILGLYIFGKNLVLVKRFVQSKSMGDILSFYYGKFYRSAEYQRWSGGRSQRSRRVMHGQKIFMGWRQQELLSRIFSHLSEDIKNRLLEVSRRFGEGKMSFEDYVFTMKDAVGIEILIQSVGIGQGKKDLTSTAMEPVKTNHSVSANPEIPSGKACSALTPADIIKFLTGGFRLSKARSSDLFWEAVWPRLLARGWHSEQPNDLVISRNSLVFLVPGVRKFSRRRLKKGIHYFDSVTDVLNKVASEPELLKLKSEEAKEGGNKEENGVDPSLDEISDSSSDDKRQRYLQPRSLYHKRNLAKFTIMDTSMAYSAGGKVRQLRNLPAEPACLSRISSNFSGESDQNTAEKLEREAEVTTTSNGEAAITDGRPHVEASNCENGALGTEQNDSSGLVDASMDNHDSQSALSPSEKQQQKKQKVRSRCTKYVSIGRKRHGPKVSVHGESSCCGETDSRGRKLNKAGSQCGSNLPDGYDTTASKIPMHNKLSPASSLAEDTRLQRDLSLEKPAARADFDLNVPQHSPEFEADETVITDTVQNDESSCADHSSAQAESSLQSQSQEIPNGEASTDQNFNRRQSKRSRPLTAKALEALAYGYLSSPKRKRKDPEARPKSSRQVRSRAVVTADFRNGTSALDSP